MADEHHAPSDGELRAEARQRVIAIRGSDDAPGFDLCVEAELREMKQSLRGEP